MKNSIKTLLRAGVFALAAVFAFAFTQPLDSTQTYYAWDDQREEVVPVTIGSTQFNCDENITVDCLFQDPQLMNPVSEYEGKFELISP